MSSKYRILWRRLFQSKINYYRSMCQVPILKIPRGIITVPCTIGFSIFTWIGFDKKPSAEDELILTIKHCVLFIQKQEYEKAEQLLHVALRQAQQIQHELGITYIYDVMANLALEREQLDKAKQLFVSVAQRLMTDGATEDDLRIVHISVKLARISHLKKEYATAKLGYEWCLQKLNDKIAGLPPDDEMKKFFAMTEDWYGRLLLDCEQCDNGLNLMLSSLDRIRNIEDLDKEHVVVQLNDIGTIYERLGNIDESISYFNQAIDIGKQLPGMSELGATYVNLGRVYMKKNLLDKARKSCGKGWQLGVMSKNDDIKKEAELCLKEIKNIV